MQWTYQCHLCLLVPREASAARDKLTHKTVLSGPLLIVPGAEEAAGVHLS